MSTQFSRETYDNISQRAVVSYCRGLCAFDPVAASEDDAASQRDLHAYFTALYARMFGDPARFGMPVTPDDGLAALGEPTERKTELNRKLKKPRDVLAMAVGMLQEMGRTGRLVGGDLLLEQAQCQALLGVKPKVKVALLAAMGEAGLTVQDTDGGVSVGNGRFPRMMPALKALAEACAAHPEPLLGAFHFARCDFRALIPGHPLDALSLLAFFPLEDRERALRLHTFLLETGHKPTCRTHGVSAWIIDYQCPRKIKGSPILQIGYQERTRDPLQVYIKCASTDRLLPFFAEQPEALRDDLRSRVYRCGAPSCTWCKTRKALGPSLLEHRGEKLAICWYTRPDMPGLHDDTLQTLQGYIHSHQKLA